MAAREKWSRIIEEQRASGLTVARFCAERRIPASSFFPWRKRLESVRANPAFVEATVRVESALPGVIGGVGIQVGSAGRRVIVARGFDRQLLVEVIQALESMGAADRSGASS